MTFIGRKKELAVLDNLYSSKKAEFFVLYGRRRVGKTELLRHFAQNKKAIYYVATESDGQDNLNQLTEQCLIYLNRTEDSLIQDITFKNIESLLSYLLSTAHHDKENRLVLILDEFQYWASADKTLASQIQRFWDAQAKRSKLMLILCGSSISLMTDYVLAEKSPLYGRRTGQMQLNPFDFRVAAEFFPNWSDRDKLLAYGVLGGMPAYLNHFDPKISFGDNIIQYILNRNSFLGQEAEFLLKTELREINSYARILKLIASGNSSLKDLTSKANQNATTIGPYLSNLQTLQLVTREVSLSERAPERSRKGRYYIKDNFLKFWFRFVEPNISLVELGQGKLLYHEAIENQLFPYMGSIFEDICKQYVQYYGQENGLPIPKRVGRVWGRDFDLDIVAETIEGNYIFGECKWSKNPISAVPEIVNLLQERANKSGLNTDKAKFLLFSSSDFKRQAKLKKESDTNISATLISDKELLGINST